MIRAYAVLNPPGFQNFRAPLALLGRGYRSTYHLNEKPRRTSRKRLRPKVCQRAECASKSSTDGGLPMYFKPRVPFEFTPNHFGFCQPGRGFLPCRCVPLLEGSRSCTRICASVASSASFAPPLSSDFRAGHLHLPAARYLPTRPPVAGHFSTVPAAFLRWRPVVWWGQPHQRASACEVE